MTTSLSKTFWTFGPDALTLTNGRGLCWSLPWGELAAAVAGTSAAGQPVTVHQLDAGRHAVTVGPVGGAACIAKFGAGELEGFVMTRGFCPEHGLRGAVGPEVDELAERPLADRLVELQQALAARDEATIGRVLRELVATTAELRGAVARMLLDARAIMAGDLQALAWSLDSDARRRLAHALVQLEHGAPLIDEGAAAVEAAQDFAREQAEAMFVAVLEGRPADASQALALLASNDAGRLAFVEALKAGLGRLRRESPEMESMLQDEIAPAVGVELPPLECDGAPEVLH